MITPVKSEDTPSPTTVSIPITVQVTPTTNPTGLTFNLTHDSIPINNNWIWVGANTATITFTLSLNGTGTATFANPAVQWLIDGQLTTTGPVNISYTGDGTSTLTFTDYDFARTTGGNPHQFYLLVSYTPPGSTATTYWSPDPTIINKEPPTTSL